MTGMARAPGNEAAAPSLHPRAGDPGGAGWGSGLRRAEANVRNRVFKWLCDTMMLHPHGSPFGSKTETRERCKAELSVHLSIQRWNIAWSEAVAAVGRHGVAVRWSHPGPKRRPRHRSRRG